MTKSFAVASRVSIHGIEATRSGKKIFKGREPLLASEVSHSLLEQNALLELLFVTQCQPGFLLYLWCSAVTQTLSVSHTAALLFAPLLHTGDSVPDP